MKVQEIRDMAEGELRSAIADKAEELANLKFQLALYQLDNTSKVQRTRRDLARMKTIFREHERRIRRLKGENAAAKGGAR